MNKAKKGFTLIELIGVIVIILLLMLIATPIVVNYVKKTKEDIGTIQLKTIKDSARNWASSKENIKYLPTVNGECVEVTLGELKNKGYIDLNITNPETDEPYSDSIKVVIKKVDNTLTYEINETNEQVCETIIDTGVPNWIYVESNKKIVGASDTVTIKIKSNQEVDTNNLIAESIIVRVGNQIQDEAIINIKNCNTNGLISCDVEVSNVKGDGVLNLVIDKDTLVKEDKKSKTTVLTTDVLVDTKGPVIAYKGRENTNKNIKYATNGDTVTIKLEAKDESIITGEIKNIKVYVAGEEKNVTKTITKNGNNYELVLKNIEGNGSLTVVIDENEIQDEVGNGNKETIITPGITIDNNLPVIVYNANGSEEYSTYYDVEIKVSDSETGVDNETLKYKWNTSTTGNGEIAFSNNSTVRIEEVTGNYYLIGEACDNAGNCIKEISKVYKLSNEGPTIVLGTNGNTSYAKSASTKITVTSKTGELDNNSLVYVVSTDKEAVPTISYENNETITLKDLTGDYYLIVKACDNVGNCTTITSKAYHLDNEGPSITYGTNGNTSYSKTGSTKITITDNNEINEDTIKYIVAKEKDTEPTKVLLNGATISLGEVTGDYYVVTEACDTVGNCTKMPSNIFYMDNTAPTIVYGTNGNSTYQKSHSTTVIATDSHSTLNTLKYITSTSNTATPSTALTNGETVTISSGTGNYYVVTEACDKAGNCATLASNVFKMDNTAPTITYGTNGNSSYSKTGSTTVSVNANTGEVDTIKYIVSTDKTATPTTSLTSGGTVSLNGLTGDYYVIVKACDKAGNCKTEVSNVFKMDNTAPTITYGTNGNSTYAKSRSTTITAIDGHSTLNTLKYITGTSKTATPSTSLTSGGTVTISGVTGNYYVVSQACDKAGNCATLASNVFKMDNTAPTITYGTNGNSTYAKSRSTTITATDGHSTLNTLKYITSTSNTATPSTTLTSGGTVTISGVTGNYYVVSQACDKAGNCATLASNVFKMDNTAPTITYGTNGNSIYAKSRSTTIIATDGHSTLNTLKYITSTSNTATPSTTLTSGGTVTISGVTGNYYVVSQACDKAGNCATLASNVFKMDNTAPTITYGTNGNSAYAKTASTKVTASDSHSTLNTLKYITSTSKTATPATALTNGGTVSLSGLTGTYYVVSQACDKAGNCATLASNPFYQDNTKPTVTATVSIDTAVITIKDTISLAGYEVTTSSSPTSYTATSGTSQTITYTATESGTYYVHVKDSAGNTASTTFEINLSYDAEATTSTYSATKSCSTTSCNCQHGNGNGVGHCNYDVSVGLSVSWNQTCSYSCPNGGTLSGTTCTKTTYSCPNGGTLNGTICEF